MEPGRELTRRNDIMSDIPTIDFNPFMLEKGAVCGKAPTVEQRQCASEINEAFRVHGFLFLQNIGVSEEDLKTYYDMAKDLFALSDQHKKTKLKPLDPDSNVGYAASGIETLNSKRPPDLKEVSCILGSMCGPFILALSSNL